MDDELAQNPNVCYFAFVTGRYDLMAIIVIQCQEFGLYRGRCFDPRDGYRSVENDQTGL
jgi:hypothetical protein